MKKNFSSLITPRKIITLITVVVICLVCIIPMGWNPIWNGEQPLHKDQYERMGNSLLHGQLDLGLKVSPELQKMNNPYSPEEREALGVDYKWDHAYYNGKYYMYFGVVPAVFVFAPYQLITGHALTTYHATQLFAVIIIVGIFVLFAFLRKKYFTWMKYGIYLLLSSAVSLMCVWYSVDAPSLYCTAITAAMGLEVWSLYCFIRSVSNKQSKKQWSPWFILGSLFGALAFGCRPTIALMNIVVIPILWQIMKTEKKVLSWRFISKVCLGLLPYLVVGILLMLYNYARFDNPFEFGAAYQLTMFDISSYSSSGLHLRSLVNGLLMSFFGFNGLSSEFPFVQFGGVLWEFPVLFLVIFGLTRREVRLKLKEYKLHYLSYLLLIISALIVLAIVRWSPVLLERYHMDIYLPLGVLCFIVVGCWRNLPNWLIALLCIVSMAMSVLLFLVPHDLNLTALHLLW